MEFERGERIDIWSETFALAGRPSDSADLLLLQIIHVDHGSAVKAAVVVAHVVRVCNDHL